MASPEPPEIPRRQPTPPPLACRQSPGGERRVSNTPSRPRPTIVTQAASTNISRVNSGASLRAVAGGLGGLHPPGQSWTSHSGNTSRTGAGESGIDEERVERPDFAPFFTLVNDASSAETWHPRNIHYIFSDDDASELLTEALLESAASGDFDIRNEDDGEEEGGEEESSDGKKGVGTATTTTTSSSSSSATFRRDGSLRTPTKQPKPSKSSAKAESKPPKPPSKPEEREERVIIVDINTKGDGIERITSLTPSWQILNAELGNAPTWDDAPQTQGPGAGLMLRIEGTCVPKADVEVGKEVGVGLGIEEGDKEKEFSEEEMQGLLEGFDRKMGVLRRVMSRGEREVGGDEEKEMERGDGEKMLGRGEEKMLGREGEKMLAEEQ